MSPPLSISAPAHSPIRGDGNDHFTQLSSELHALIFHHVLLAESNDPNRKDPLRLREVSKAFRDGMNALGVLSMAWICECPEKNLLGKPTPFGFLEIRERIALAQQAYTTIPGHISQLTESTESSPLPIYQLQRIAKRIAREFGLEDPKWAMFAPEEFYGMGLKAHDSEIKSQKKMVKAIDLKRRKIQRKFNITIQQLPKHSTIQVREDWLNSNHEELKKLKELPLAEYKISYASPSVICKFDGLETLDLESNQLFTIPKHLCSLKNLKVLNLGNNKLKELPDEIQNLHELTELFLYRNQLSIIPDGLFSLTQLQELSLMGNLLEELSGKVGQLKQLRYLNLKENPLRKIPRSLEAIAGRFDCDQTCFIPAASQAMNSQYTFDILKFPSSVKAVNCEEGASFSVDTSFKGRVLREFGRGLDKISPLASLYQHLVSSHNLSKNTVMINQVLQSPLTGNVALKFTTRAILSGVKGYNQAIDKKIKPQLQKLFYQIPPEDQELIRKAFCAFSKKETVEDAEIFQSLNDYSSAIEEVIINKFETLSPEDKLMLYRLIYNFAFGENERPPELLAALESLKQISLEWGTKKQVRKSLKKDQEEFLKIVNTGSYYSTLINAQQAIQALQSLCKYLTPNASLKKDLSYVEKEIEKSIVELHNASKNLLDIKHGIFRKHSKKREMLLNHILKIEDRPNLKLKNLSEEQKKLCYDFVYFSKTFIPDFDLDSFEEIFKSKRFDPEEAWGAENVYGNLARLAEALHMLEQRRSLSSSSQMGEAQGVEDEGADEG